MSVTNIDSHKCYVDVRFQDFEGSWSIRIQSSYLVRRVKVSFALVYLYLSNNLPKTREVSDDNTFLGFERLTCVPIQTRMVKESMLTKAEKAWLRVSLDCALRKSLSNSLFFFTSEGPQQTLSREAFPSAVTR